jgi:hypothetical protein
VRILNICMNTLLFAAIGLAGAQNADAQEINWEIYGAAQADLVQDFNRVDPAWDDTLRPSKIPTTEGVFGDDGQSFISARQSRFGLRAGRELAGRPFLVKFEFDLFGAGANEGETTFHLQHFYGQWGPILAGRTDTVFMDGDIFPNTIDYWGPPGMVYVRNPQIRYTHTTGAHEFAVALEMPSDDIDPGQIRIIDPSIGANLQGDEEVPDLTGHYRYTGGWGHFQAGALMRSIGYETAGTPGNEPADDAFGWGINLTSNIKLFKSDVIHLGLVYGEGIASYMNDGGVDLAPDGVIGDLTGEPVPLLGYTAYYDHSWNDQWTSSIGYSRTEVDNTSFQAGDAFHSGEYASVNLLYRPDPNLLIGGEVLWGRREDNNGDDGDDTRLQISLRYSFSSNDFRGAS